MPPLRILVLLFSLTLFSCGASDQKQVPTPDSLVSSGDTTLQNDTSTIQGGAQKSSIDTYMLTIDGTNTLTIDRKAAVFYQPDSLQIEKRMKQVGEADFRTGMDDYIYYINISGEYLKKQGLPVIDAKNKKYLKFVLADKKTKLIRLDTLEELWGLYLFDPKKKPHYADIIDIEEDYKNYYK